MLKDRILKKETGLLFYSLTPPKITTEIEKIDVIAGRQTERLAGTPIDALILYDIQDESTRTDQQRPFSFIPTLPPAFYSQQYLEQLTVPKIIYKSIANTTKEDFAKWLQENNHFEHSVFVGASSQQQPDRLSLAEAYEMKKQLRPSMLLGGVTIPERHLKKGDEHLRIARKIDSGCSFFVSQCIYSADNAKNLLSDYYYAASQHNQPLVPIIFTLAPCGSLKTLQFMEWLGIDVPKWLHNELKHSTDILAKSLETCKNIAADMMDYAVAKNIPIGFNIESVSIKKEEIDASLELLQHVSKMVKKDTK